MPTYTPTSTGTGLGQIFAPIDQTSDSLGAAILRILNASTPTLCLVIFRGSAASPSAASSNWEIGFSDDDETALGAIVTANGGDKITSNKDGSGRTVYDWINDVEVGDPNLFDDATARSLLAVLNYFDGTDGTGFNASALTNEDADQVPVFALLQGDTDQGFLYCFDSDTGESDFDNYQKIVALSQSSGATWER